jgi:hypothetical protein
VLSSKLHLITTALVTPGIGLPEWGLRQSAFKKDKELQMEDWEREDRDTRIDEFRAALIYEVLEEVYPEHMAKLRGASEQLDQVATFPEILRIDPPLPERRSPIPLMPIQISEDTVSGNMTPLAYRLRRGPRRNFRFSLLWRHTCAQRCFRSFRPSTKSPCHNGYTFITIRLSSCRLPQFRYDRFGRGICTVVISDNVG